MSGEIITFHDHMNGKKRQMEYIVKHAVKNAKKYPEKKSGKGFTKNTTQHSSKKLRRMAKNSRRINRTK